MSFISKLLAFGSDKDLKRYQKTAASVNDLEPTYVKMTDEELRSQTERFRKRFAAGESLDALLPEAFAVVREASKRTTGLRHFDVQLIGGMALHAGQIAEMKTGEGKTLVSTLAGYLNAIPGTGVHIVTVNDYLAKRDSEWMGQIYRFLGMEVGLLQSGMPVEKKRRAYAADVTYGTNSEFGFDYLRDNMVIRAERRVQRGHAYAIVDEVDSILIDEARTPLIISGQGTRSASTYKDFARAVRGLKRGQEVMYDPLMGGEPPEPDGDFIMDEAKHTIAATEQGLKKIEARLGIDDIYADLSGALVNHLQQALKAQYLFHRDKQYVVTNGEVKIVDEFTGRIMEGRRYSEGLHQAIEAKEGVLVREENQTLATITLQNYFRLYDKLAGMTGTALTEDAEFREIYNLPVQVIPPNKPVIREDHDDLVYRTISAKFEAVADEVAARHAAGQPVLVGTVSIESSEKLSRILNKRGIPHEVLNAKFHEREAHIVAQAGREGAVTIATNMAGRGTDILLGGNPDELAQEMITSQGIALEDATPEELEEAKSRARAICAEEREHVLAAGGLTVIGTERHEDRRIDNQLRGRSGRQGDPGETQFYLSLEDDLMRMFGGENMDRVSSWMVNWDMPDDVPIQAKVVTKAVESAQRKVEDINYSMRKNVLEYDDVMNRQRKVIYEERNKVLDGKDLGKNVDEIIRDVVERRLQDYCAVDAHGDESDVDGLRSWLTELTGRTDLPALEVANEREPYQELHDEVLAYVKECYRAKEERWGDELMASLNTQIMLRVIDTRWMSYLQEMDYLKTGIGLRGYGQRDPLVEYKTEAYKAFQQLTATMYEDYLRTVLRVELKSAPTAQPDDAPALRHVRYSGAEEVDGDSSSSPARRQVARPGQSGRTPAGAAAQAAGRPVQGANPGVAKPKTYRKSESDDPYVNVGRNEPCPCGSGKKFKNCHGRYR